MHLICWAYPLQRKCKNKFDDIVLEKLKLEKRPKDMSDWNQMVAKIKAQHEQTVKIAVVGKYIELQDAYISVVEALKHAAIANDAKLELKWIDSEKLEDKNINLQKTFEDIDGIIVPGGFGDRGVEGKILASAYAREQKIPYYGLCLGMQIAVMDFARHVVGLEGAHSTEFQPKTKYPVIDLMSTQVDVADKGGTMRLGQYPCKLNKDSISYQAYDCKQEICERHRQRYEFNNIFRAQLAAKGLVFAGVSPDDQLVEIIELPKYMHPWFVAVQFHPELKSRPTNPHPLFREFIKASLNRVK